jgi:hypothetical protein
MSTSRSSVWLEAVPASSVEYFDSSPERPKSYAYQPVTVAYRLPCGYDRW